MSRNEAEEAVSVVFVISIYLWYINRNEAEEAVSVVFVIFVVYQ